MRVFRSGSVVDVVDFSEERSSIRGLLLGRVGIAGTEAVAGEDLEEGEETAKVGHLDGSSSQWIGRFVG